MNDTSQKQIIIVKSEKSVGLACALAFFFGPIGLLYSTPKGAIIMFFVNCFVGLFTLGFGLILTWPICAVWGWNAASKHNKQLHAAASK
jgi:hypothetical protein